MPWTQSSTKLLKRWRTAFYKYRHDRLALRAIIPPRLFRYLTVMEMAIPNTPRLLQRLKMASISWRRCWNPRWTSLSTSSKYIRCEISWLYRMIWRRGWGWVITKYVSRSILYTCLSFRRRCYKVEESLADHSFVESPTPHLHHSTDTRIHPSSPPQTPGDSQTEPRPSLHTCPQRRSDTTAQRDPLSVHHHRRIFPRLLDFTYESRGPIPQSLLLTLIQRLETAHNERTIRCFAVTCFTATGGRAKAEDAEFERRSWGEGRLGEQERGAESLHRGWC